MLPTLATANEKLIPAWLQPVTLLDLLAARQVSEPPVFAGTGLFSEDRPFTQVTISAPQFNRLLANSNQQWSGTDFNFQLGHQVAKQGLGPLAALAQQQTSLSEWLQTLWQFQPLLAPSLCLRIYPVNPTDYFVLFTGSTQLEPDPNALRVAITVCTSLLKRRAESAKVDAYFQEKTPVDVEHFDTLVAAKCHFRAPFNGFRVSSKPRDKALTQSSLSAQVASNECRLLCTRSYLLNHLQHILWSPSKEQASLATSAQRLGTSPATLKRRLAESGNSFQQVLDTMRKDRSVIDLLVMGASTEQVSSRLHFHDSSNFRRAFKRWTGTTPGRLKIAYDDLFTAN